MKLELEFGEAYCYTRIFKINGISAHYEEFGEMSDDAVDEAEDYGCGDMQFHPFPSTPDILNKYNITVEEYHEIVEKLRKGLSFGICGWCV